MELIRMKNSFQYLIIFNHIIILIWRYAFNLSFTPKPKIDYIIEIGKEMKLKDKIFLTNPTV
jgi:hypothetical protein